MIAAALLALAQSAAPGRFRAAELELTGPLAALRLELEGRAVTHLALDLAPGERRALVVPLCAEPDARELRVVEEPECAGEARWIGWVREGFDELDAQWRALPPALRARPAVAAPRGAPGREPEPGGLSAALALVVLALALRRRPALAAGLALPGAALVFLWVARRAPEPPQVRVLEGDGASGRWLAIDSGWQRLSAPAAPPLRLDVEPASARVEARAQLGAGGVERWELAAPGAALRRCVALDPGPRGLDPDHNRWGRLEPVWTRTADGRWTRHAAWDSGAPLPPGEPGDPPGALNPALPSGVRIVIGALAPGGFAGPGEARGPVWLRWVGE